MSLIDENKSNYNDFTGFTFDGRHSSDLKILRVTNGNRYEVTQQPTFQDEIVQVGGRDGSYLFGSYYQRRDFSINIAFDNVSEKELREIQNWGADKKVHKLIFDEQPYKYYNVKLASPTELKYICFDESEDNNHLDWKGDYQEDRRGSMDRRRRLYKGEGTIKFVCYEPFARSTLLSKEQVFNNEADLIKVYINKDITEPFEIPIKALNGIQSAQIYLSRDWLYNRGDWGLPDQKEVNGQIIPEAGQRDPYTGLPSTNYYAYQPQRVQLVKQIGNSVAFLKSDYQIDLFPINFKTSFFGMIDQKTLNTNGKLINMPDKKEHNQSIIDAYRVWRDKEVDLGENINSKDQDITKYIEYLDYVQYLRENPTSSLTFVGWESNIKDSRTDYDMKMANGYSFDDPFYDSHYEERRTEIVQYDPQLKVTFGPSSSTIDECDVWEEYGCYKLVLEGGLPKKVNNKYVLQRIEKIEEPYASWSGQNLIAGQSKKIYNHIFEGIYKENREYFKDDNGYYLLSWNDTLHLNSLDIENKWFQEDYDKILIVKDSLNTLLTNGNRSIYFLPNKEEQNYYMECLFEKEDGNHSIKFEINLLDKEDMPPNSSNTRYDVGYFVEYYENLYNNYVEWKDTINLPEVIPDWENHKLNFSNAGDIDMPFVAYYKFNDQNKIEDELSLTDGSKLKINITKKEDNNDYGVVVNTHLHIIQGYTKVIPNNEKILTSSIYNRYITGGDFFLIPTGESTLTSQVDPDLSYEYRYF